VCESVLYATASAVSIGRSAAAVSLLRAAAETLTAANAASLAGAAVRSASLHTLPLTQYNPNYLSNINKYTAAVSRKFGVRLKMGQS